MTTIRKLVPRAIVLLGLLSPTGCEGPRPVALLAFWDASASSLPFQKECQEIIPQQTRRLLPKDSLSLYRVAQTVTTVHAGPALGNSLKSTFRTYFQVDPKERGTSMGMAFRLASRDAHQLATAGYRPVILFLGDLADERGPGTENIDWESLPRLAAELPPETKIVCMFSEPHFTERLTSSLLPILKDRLILINPELARSTGGRRLLRDAIGR